MATPVLRSSQTAKINLEIEKGETWCPIIVWKTKANPEDPNDGATEVNLTGFSARMQIRLTVDAVDPPEISLVTPTGIVLGGATGTIQPIIADTVTAGLAWNSAFYDLELVDTTGKVIKFMAGKVKATNEVTR